MGGGIFKFVLRFITIRRIALMNRYKRFERFECESNAIRARFERFECDSSHDSPKNPIDSPRFECELKRDSPFLANLKCANLNLISAFQSRYRLSNPALSLGDNTAHPAQKLRL